MKKQDYFILAVMAAALFSAQSPAHAQGLMPGIQFGGAKQVSPEEQARRDALARAARDAQSSIPTPKASNDPWADVRAAEPASSKSRKSRSLH